MKSIWILASNNIKRRRLQSIILGLLMIISSLLFSTGIGVILSIRSPVEDMFERTNASDESLFVYGKYNANIDAMVQWWSEKEEIYQVETYKMADDVQALYPDRDNGVSVFVVEKPVNANFQNKLEFVGEESDLDFPNPGEVWIPTSVASTYGLEIGDTIELSEGKEKAEVTVSAIVIDPFFSASMLNPKRLWVAPDQISLMFPSDSQLSRIINLDFEENVDNINDLWDKFKEFTNNSFAGMRAQKPLVAYVYNNQYMIIGGVLLLFSIMILLMARYIISFNISNGIMADYKNIGIMKSQGFSIMNIRLIYMIQYIAIALVAAPIGIILSYFVIRTMVNSLLETIGLTPEGLNYAIPFIASFLVLLLIVVVTTFMRSSAVKNVDPVQAIRVGAPERRAAKKPTRMGFDRLKKFSISMAVAINYIFANKGQALSLYLAVFTTIFNFTFVTNLSYSVSKMIDDRAYWGYNNADVAVISKDPLAGLTWDKFKDLYEENEMVDSVIAMQQYVNVAPGKDLEESASFLATVFDGDLDAIGQVNVDGYNPINSDEVSLAVVSARKYEKNVGDNIEIIINGTAKEFYITGIYQTMENAGEGFRISADAIRECDPNFVVSSYSVKLNDSEDRNEFIDLIDDENPDEATISDIKTEVTDQVGQVSSGVSLATRLISIITLLSGFFNVFSFTMIAIINDRKTFGIYKSLGMTSVQIRKALVFRTLIMATIATVLSIIQTLIMSPFMLTAFMGGFGIGRFPFRVDVITTALILPISLAIFTFSTWISGRSISKISPRNLIEE